MERAALRMLLVSERPERRELPLPGRRPILALSLRASKSVELIGAVCFPSTIGIGAPSMACFSRLGKRRSISGWGLLVPSMMPSSKIARTFCRSNRGKSFAAE